MPAIFLVKPAEEGKVPRGSSTGHSLECQLTLLYLPKIKGLPTNRECRDGALGVRGTGIVLSIGAVPLKTAGGMGGLARYVSCFPSPASRTQCGSGTFCQHPVGVSFVSLLLVPKDIELGNFYLRPTYGAFVEVASILHLLAALPTAPVPFSCDASEGGASRLWFL